MNTEASRTAHASATQNAGASPWSLLTDFSRQQLILWAESACTLLRGSETIRNIQQQAAHDACSHHEEAAQKLRDQGEPADILAIQADLLRLNLQAAAQYWQQIASAVIKTQIDFAACNSQLLQTVPGNSLKPALAAWQSALYNPLNSSSNQAGAAH